LGATGGMSTRDAFLVAQPTYALAGKLPVAPARPVSHPVRATAQAKPADGDPVQAVVCEVMR